MDRATRALAALLSYPTEESRAALPEIRAALATLPAAPLALCDHLGAGTLLDRQEDYVALFDRSRAVSLHLFEHVHGAGRERGPAMVELKAIYAAAGLDPDPRELPDFLPMLLEYAAIEPAKGAELLANAAPVLDLIHARLVQRASPYAAALHAALALAGLAPSAKPLAVPEPEDTPETLDAAYEETPVTFGPGGDPAAEASGAAECGPMAIAARLRAARRAVIPVNPRRPVVRHVAAARS